MSLFRRLFILRLLLHILVVMACVTTAGSCWAQNTAESPSLLRRDRPRQNQDTCVLVRRDGQYHLEVLEGAKTRILEGTLSPEQLHNLERTLTDEKLFRLQQDEIRPPLIDFGLDKLFLSILRPGHWQN